MITWRLKCNLLDGLPPTWRCNMPAGHSGPHFVSFKWETARYRTHCTVGPQERRARPVVRP